MIGAPTGGAALLHRARSFVCLSEAARVLQSVTAPVASWSVPARGFAARFFYPGVLEVVDPATGRSLARSKPGGPLRVDAKQLPMAMASTEARFWRDEQRRDAEMLLAHAIQACRREADAVLYRKPAELASLGTCEILFLWPGVVVVEVSSGRRGGPCVVARSVPGRPEDLDAAFAALVRGH